MKKKKCLFFKNDKKMENLLCENNSKRGKKNIYLTNKWVNINELISWFAVFLW